MWPFKQKVKLPDPPPPPPPPQSIPHKFKVGKVVATIIERGDSPRALSITFIGRAHRHQGEMWTDMFSVKYYHYWFVRSAIRLFNDWIDEDIQFRAVNDDETIFINVDDIKEINITYDDDFEKEYNIMIDDRI